VVLLGEQLAVAVEEHIDDPERLARPAELQPHHHHQEEAEEQEAERRHSVLDADPLVILREDVLRDEGLVVSLFLLHHAQCFGERLLGVPRVHPLRSDPDLSFLSHTTPQSGVGQAPSPVLPLEPLGTGEGACPTHVSHYPLKVNETAFDSFGATVMLCSCCPYFSCHATSVYVPGGRLAIVNFPSGAETA